MTTNETQTEPAPAVAVRELAADEFIVVRKDDARISAKVENQFNNEALPVVLISKKDRTALGLAETGSVVTISVGVRIAKAAVACQFKELLNNKYATCNDLLADALDVNAGDIVHVKKEV